jgi:N-dimethylarginine dimethylaminohydrolase
LEKIRHLWKRVHALSRDETMQFIGNGVVINGHFITPRITENLKNILAEESLQPVVVETTEFEKSGGSCFCMKTFVD